MRRVRTERGAAMVEFIVGAVFFMVPLYLATQALGGVPSIVLGPGSIAQAHTAEEFVPIDHLSRAAELYAGTALNLAALLPPSGSADR